MVDPGIFYPFYLFPGQCPSFRSRQILHRVKRKTSKICDCPAHLPTSPYQLLRTERMRAVCNYRHPSNRLLQSVSRMKHCLLLFYNFKNPLIITRNTSQINRDYRLCLSGDRVFQGIIIHLITVFRHIYQYELRSNMADRTCRCRICIC